MAEVRPSSETLRFPNFIERYTTQRFVINVDENDGSDQFIFLHSNGLVLVGLARTHPVCKAQDIKVAINTQKENQVKGRHKFGAQNVKPKTVLITVVADGVEYKVHALTSGRLLEMNESLTDHPELLKNESEGKGFVAILQKNPNEKNPEEMESLSLEEFCKLRNLEVPHYIPLPVANEEYDIDDYN
ncbi:hypothetical protein EIN_225720 [Entamoeba invadens IP1]|uniref:Actin-binding transcription modulator n=1 Tax=Entamoeba invadens IP1 TaxID=370355 RepID=A0A0A1U2H6_ENTIV|nr:hypothetical protein EIN_225720 [Entamoeba invadens IP1]ELP88239.1 hypothetical protein EIN_225720 [Entamoeba invadens IP1]|eukprot:XP_004255010.1 hypothetical protein EIN_225720 [Entamoeba invadens IP1]